MDAGLIPITVPELLWLLRDHVIPPPGETGPTGCTGRTGAAATSTAPAKPTNAGTPPPGVPGTSLCRSKLRPGLRKPNSRLPGV